MNDNSWVRDYFEALALVIGAVIGACAVIFVSWWLGKGVEFLTGSTPAGYTTFGIFLFLLTPVYAVTLGRIMLK